MYTSIHNLKSAGAKFFRAILGNGELPEVVGRLGDGAWGLARSSLLLSSISDLPSPIFHPSQRAGRTRTTRTAPTTQLAIASRVIQRRAQRILRNWMMFTADVLDGQKRRSPTTITSPGAILSSRPRCKRLPDGSRMETARSVPRSDRPPPRPIAMRTVIPSDIG